MKKPTLILIVLLTFFTSNGFAFEGIITIKEVEYDTWSDEDMFESMGEMGAMIQQQMEAEREENISAISEEIARIEADLKTASGDDKKWLEQDLAMLRDELKDIQGEGDPEVYETTSTSLIKGNMFKVTSNEDEDNTDFIFKPGRVITVNHDNQFYTEMTIDEIKAQIAQVTEMMKPRMPSQQKAAEKKAPAGEISKIKTGKTEKILGYTCQHIIFSQDDSRIELWVTDELDNIMKPLMEATNEMTSAFDDLGEESGAEMLELEAVKQLDGFPMRTVITHDGEVISENEVTNIQKRSVSDSEFQPPTGYKKMDAKEMMGGFPGAQ